MEQLFLRQGIYHQSCHKLLLYLKHLLLQMMQKLQPNLQKWLLNLH
jgi:hypothetical protein